MTWGEGEHVPGDEPWPQAKAFEQALLHGQLQAAQRVFYFADFTV